MHIVYLTASRVPDEWAAAYVDRLRAKLIGLGYHLGPFQFHVMLARFRRGASAWTLSAAASVVSMHRRFHRP